MKSLNMFENQRLQKLNFSATNLEWCTMYIERKYFIDFENVQKM